MLDSVGRNWPAAERKWPGRMDLPALSLPKGAFDLLLPNHMPVLIEIYGILLMASDRL
jgi:hypothetical protein